MEFEWNESKVKQGATSKSMALLLMKLKQFLMIRWRVFLMTFGIPLMNSVS
jgi:hypothetical protein